MVKRLATAALVIVLLAVIGGSVCLYLRRDMATIVCVPRDHGTRARLFCIMNPFRDRSAEVVAEQVLRQLSEGNTGVLQPYLADKDPDNRERYLSNEREYQITSWHSGTVDTNGDELSIQFWVSRSNYPANREEVRFFFSRADGIWNLDSYTAIY